MADDLYCAPCTFFRKSPMSCSIGKVAPGQDIRTVSGCSHRELTPAQQAPTPDTAGKTPAKEA